MQTKNQADKYVQIVMSSGQKIEKQQLLVKAIMEDQIKFLNTCKRTWGDDYYSQIVADC